MRWPMRGWRIGISCSASATKIPMTSCRSRKLRLKRPSSSIPDWPARGPGAYKTDYSWDFSGAEAEYRNALELDPSDATVHQWYSQHLANIGGPGQESIDEANRPPQLDPLSVAICSGQADAYSFYLE